MRRSEQARMLIGLTFPGSGPAAGPEAAPPAAVTLLRRWFDARGKLARVQRWSHRHGLEGYRVSCFLALLVCGVPFGLLVGAFVGFMETATPPADLPHSLAQMATSDVQWADKTSQSWSAPHPPFEPATERRRASYRQHPAGDAAQSVTRHEP